MACKKEVCPCALCTRQAGGGVTTLICMGDMLERSMATLIAWGSGMLYNLEDFDLMEERSAEELYPLTPVGVVQMASILFCSIPPLWVIKKMKPFIFYTWVLSSFFSINKYVADYCTMAWQLKKFPLSCENFDNQSRSSWPKTVESEMMLQAFWVWLVSLFNGISTFVGYLMPKPFS